ncbi:Fanconi anemia core complex-associated protein 100 [Lissotriton helveticus]
MAESCQKVSYLAEFRCPRKVLTVGNSRILCQQSTIYLCNGSEFAYVYNKEEKGLKAIYQFPGKIWNIELVSQQGLLYVLCAGKGIYFVSTELRERSSKEPDLDRSGGSCPPIVHTVGSEDCILTDSTICTFTIVNGILVTVSKWPGRWRIQKFQSDPGHQQTVNYQPIGEVDIPTYFKSEVDETKMELRFLPFLCCLAPCGSKPPDKDLAHSRLFMVEAPLFSLLFGVDAAMVHSPMVLCGFPDGRLCCIPLKTVAVHSLKSVCPSVQDHPSGPQLLLYHLEQPVVHIGALRRHPGEGDGGHQESTSAGLSSVCIVAIGHQGKCVTVTAGMKEGAPVLVFKEYHLGGPIISGICSGSSLYYSTPSSVFAVHKSSEDWKTERLPALLPVNLNICSAAAMTVTPRTPGGDAELLLLLSARGRLMGCRLSRGVDRPRPPRAAAKEGPKMKELLSRIGTVSERVSWLKHAIQEKNRSLSHLNQVINLSCAMLTNESHRQQFGCTVTVAWSRLLLQDSLMITCRLKNLTDYSLDHGWTLCVHVSTSDFNLIPNLHRSATIYNFPINRLLPGNHTDVTFPHHRGRNGCLELPVVVSCMLFYSLAEVLEKYLVTSYSLVSQCSPPVDLLERGVVCLPLKEHVIDMLQCLQIHSGTDQSITSSTPQSRTVTLDVVQTFLRTSMKQPEKTFLSESGKHLQEVEVMEDSTYVSPLVMSIRLSVDLLKKAFKDYSTGSPPCRAVLQWLLADNARVDAVKEQELSAAQGVAPDGRDVRLLVTEVTLNDLCPEGPVPAVEIKMESTSLAVVCSMHQAVLRRVQNVLIHDAPTSGVPTRLQVKQLREMITKNETLLKEAQALRDQLCLGKGSSSSGTREKLLSIYRDLRNPSLVIL